MNASDLRKLLDEVHTGDRAHAETLAVAAAVVSEQLRQRSMEATLVGGAAIELYAPGAHTTSDIDFVVEGRTRADLDAALTELGFVRRGRHWVRDGLFIEVPGNWMPDPVEVVRMGALPLRVIRREAVLADRIVGFKHWRATAYGAQAVALLAVFGESLDEGWLRDRLRAEGAEDALDALRRLAGSGTQITEARLQDELERLHSPKTQRPSGDTT